LLTHHRDLTIRFQDISAQLLIGSPSSPVSTAFPHPLPSLTIDLVTVLSDPSVLPLCSSEALQEGSIDCFSISPESLECTVLFKTGDVFVYKFDTEIHAPSNITDKELLSLDHIQTSSTYRPFLMIPSDRGPVSAIATSDIGALVSKPVRLISHLFL
jgi:syntaxin-binding protein 5